MTKAIIEKRNTLEFINAKTDRINQGASWFVDFRGVDSLGDSMDETFSLPASWTQDEVAEFVAADQIEWVA